MAVTDQQIRNFLQASPNMTAGQYQSLMQQYGVNINQLAEATGQNVDTLAQEAYFGGKPGGISLGALSDLGYQNVTSLTQPGNTNTQQFLGQFSNQQLGQWIQDNGLGNLQDPQQAQALMNIAQQWGINGTQLSQYLGMDPTQLANTLTSTGIPGQQLKDMGFDLTGTAGNTKQTDLLGSNPYVGNLYNLMTNPYDALKNDPGYAFQLQQGLQATNRTLAAEGFNYSGNQMAALNDYAQGTASMSYNNAVQRNLQAAGLQGNLQQAGFYENMAQQQFGLQSQAQGFNENMATQNQQFQQYVQGAQLYEQQYNDQFMQSVYGSQVLSADEQNYLMELAQLSGGNINPAQAASLYAQIQGQGSQAVGNAVGGGGGGGGGGQNWGAIIGGVASIASLFSDERLKENIKKIGQTDGGINIYSYNFIGSDVPQVGVIAQEVEKIIPEAVETDVSGYKKVFYGMLR